MAVIRDELVLIDQFTGVFERYISLGNDAATISHGIGNAAEEMTSTFSSSVGEISNSMESVHGAVSYTSQQIADKMADSFINAADEVDSSMATVQGTVINAAQQMSTEMGAAFSGAAGEVSSSMEGIQSAIADSAQQMDEAMAATFSSAAEDVANSIGAVRDVVAAATQQMNDAFTGTDAAVSKMAASLSDTAGEAGSSMETVRSAVAAAAQQIADAFIVTDMAVADIRAALSGMAGEVSSSMSVVQNAVESTSNQMDDAFTGANAAIDEMTQSVQMNAESLDAWSGSVDNANKAYNRTQTNMRQLGITTGRLLQNIEGVPKGISQIISLTGQMTTAFGGATAGTAAMTGGLNASQGVATGLMATLGPLMPMMAVIVGLGSALVSVFSEFASKGQKEIEKLTQNFEDLVGQYQTFQGELVGQYSQLEHNNELVARLNELGADSSFATRLEQENAELQRQIDLLDIWTTSAQSQASKAAYDLANSSNYYLTFSAMRVMGAGVVGGQKADLVTAIESLMQADSGDAYSSMPEWESQISQNLEDYIRQAQDIREQLDITIPEQAELYDALTRVTEAYIEQYGVQRESIDVMDDYTDAVTAAEDEIARIEAEAKAYEERLRKTEEQLKKNTEALRRYSNPVIDLAGELNNLATAHEALSGAMDIVNDSAMMDLETFYQIMSISPEYINLLFTESGAMRDLDTVTNMLTQAKIDEMGVSMARQLLDLASAYQNETGSLSGYASVVQSTTTSVWGLVDAQLALMQAMDVQHYLDMGASENTAAFYAEQNTAGLRSQISNIKSITDAAKSGAREYGVPQEVGKIGSVGNVGSVGKINDKISLADEDLRMLIDMAERKYVADVNVQTLRPEINVDVTNNGDKPLDANDIANSIKIILDEQSAMHTNTSYND